MKYTTTGGLILDTMDKTVKIRILCPQLEPIDVYIDFDDVPHGEVAQAVEELEFLLKQHSWNIIQ